LKMQWKECLLQRWKKRVLGTAEIRDI
jgi:hypothetical protein